MSQPGPRQTKKQKKALAFRSRQKSGKKNKDEDALDFPIDENQDLAGLVGLPPEAEEASAGDRSGDKKGKTRNGGQYQARSGDSNKRKREVEDEDVVLEEKSRKKSKVQPAVLESGNEVGDGQKTAEVKKKVQPQRFILFIGNLKYSTSKDAILSHFSSCEPPPTVRLPALKTTQPSSKSKGYAFLEFTDKSPLQQALRLHHSELEGRKINVELTAGGGGKSEHRVKKLQERNKGLHEQRKRRIEKRKSTVTSEVDQTELRALERPQRYSTTSGFGQAPSNKKTWSIPAAMDQDTPKNSKKRKRPPRPKDQGTGVNAIPVY
ncbi:hypothetical protein BJ322DRAFT_1107013 [Thelephora terrestris]|uniref:RRM domain-containing protein n=1 Tax=Thelephora terrestris TaxID=56493 RepID=A0A9P6HHB2_9AGAM|nr:hypothetical protein BJ322DRAFT_1107013 [Thelephora terrestris]